MDQQPLYVDYNIDIVEVSSLAMQRSQKHVYDSVIVTSDEQVYGMVSIKKFTSKTC